MAHLGSKPHFNPGKTYFMSTRLVLHRLDQNPVAWRMKDHESSGIKEEIEEKLGVPDPRPALFFSLDS